MNNDAELLRCYAEEKSEAAFAELVRRHLDLVYSAAQRRLGGDAHRAADVAQQVFLKVAREAERLSRHRVLTAWLYMATRNAALDTIRADRRRQVREQEAYVMQTILSPESSDPGWEKIRPVLDVAMDELADVDREAVLSRFFERRGYAEIGAGLGLGEDAARMRVERALEKLRVRLARRGITSATAALGAALANQAVVAAPAGLAGSVVTGAVAAGTLAGAAATTGFFMTTSTMAMGAAALIGGAFAVFQTSHVQRVGDELAAITRERDGLASQMRTARERETKAAQTTAALQRELESARVFQATTTASKTAALRPATTGENPEGFGPTPAGGFLFLKQTPSDPAEARRQARASEGANVDSAYGALYRQLGWTAAEQEQFRDLMFERKQATSKLFGAAAKAARERNPQIDRAGLYEVFEATQVQSKRDELADVRRVMGEAAGQAMERYQTTLPMRYVAGQLARELFYTEAPLAPAQAEQLIDVMTGNARGLGGRVEIGALDIEMTVAQAQGILSAPQLAELRRVALRAQEQAKLERERNTAPVPTPASKPAGG